MLKVPGEHQQQSKVAAKLVVGLSVSAEICGREEAGLHLRQHGAVWRTGVLSFQDKADRFIRYTLKYFFYF